MVFSVGSEQFLLGKEQNSRNKGDKSKINLHSIYFMALNIFNESWNLPQTSSKQMQGIL